MYFQIMKQKLYCSISQMSIMTDYMKKKKKKILEMSI